MSKNNNSTSLIIDDFQNDQKEDYTNIAKRNENNLKNQSFEKFKPKNPMINSNNILKGEENKLKKMLFSILKNEENQIIKTGKSPNNYTKYKLSNTHTISSIEDENRKKRYFNKNNKQFRKNSKKYKLTNRHRIKKSKSKIDLLYNNFISKKINTNIPNNRQKNMKRSFSNKIII